MKKILLIVSIIEFVCLLICVDYHYEKINEYMPYGNVRYCNEFPTVMTNQFIDFTPEDVCIFEEELHDKIEKSGELSEDPYFRVWARLGPSGGMCTVYIISNLKCADNEKIADMIEDERQRFYNEHSIMKKKHVLSECNE